jgi:hypothetical protein
MRREADMARRRLTGALLMALGGRLLLLAGGTVLCWAGLATYLMGALVLFSGR